MNPPGYTLEFTSGTTVTLLGTVSCSAGYRLVDPEPEPEPALAPEPEPEPASIGVIVGGSDQVCMTAGFNSATSSARCEALATAIGETFNGDAGGDMYGCFRYRDGTSPDDEAASQGWSFSSSGQDLDTVCAGDSSNMGYECLCDAEVQQNAGRRRELQGQGTAVTPYASCNTNGGNFVYSGCVEHTCTSLSSQNGSTAEYAVQNMLATTVTGLGNISCAFGFSGTPVVTCGVHGGGFTLSGCQENSCDVATFGAFTQVYQTENALQAGTSMTLTQLGALACKDGYVGTVEANCTEGSFSLGGCLPRATCGTGIGSQAESNDYCNAAFATGLLGGAVCAPTCTGTATALPGSCADASGDTAVVTCAINSSLVSSETPESCIAIPSDDAAQESEMPTVCALTASAVTDEPGTCSVSDGYGSCEYVPAVAEVTEASLCSAAGECAYTPGTTPTCDLDHHTDGSAVCPTGCQTQACESAGSGIYNPSSASAMCNGTACDLTSSADAQLCCVQSCLDFNCSALGKVAIDHADDTPSDGLGTTCCQVPPCGRPALVISTPSPLVIRRSTDTHVMAVASLGLCALPEDATLMYHWSCSDATIDLDPGTIGMSGLRLLPFSFTAGELVELNVTTWLSSNPDLNQTATMSLEVEQTPEVYASIAGGSFRTAYPGAAVVLNGTESTDPDEPFPTEWDTMQWTCQTMSGPNCTTSPPTDTLVWDLTTTIATASPGITDYRLTVGKNGRQAVSTVRVQVVDVPVPSVAIVDTAPKYSASQRIMLEGAAIPVEPAFSDMTWSWTATEDSQPLDLTDLTSTPLTNAVLVLAADALTVGRSYRFRLEANDGRGTGSCEAAILLNAGPTSGSVSVSPTSGRAVVDSFIIAAVGWVDEDIPLLYTFGYMEDATTEFILSAATSSSSTSAILPAGAPGGAGGNAYSYDVTTTVVDSYGAMASAATEVQVQPYVPAPTSNIMTDASELLGVASQSDNDEQSAQLVTAFAASLNTVVVPPATETAEEASERREQAAEMRTLLADTLMNTIADFGSPVDGDEDAAPVVIDNEKVAMLAQSLVSVSARPEEMTESSLGSSFSAVEMLSSSTSEVVSTAAVESMASAMSNLVVATSSLGGGGGGGPDGDGDGPAATVNTTQAAGYARKTVSIVEKLSKALVSNSFVGEAPVAIETDAFGLSSQKDYASSFEGSNLTVAGSADVGILVPSGVFGTTDVGDDAAVDAFVTAWATNPFAFAEDPALPGAASGGEPSRPGSSVLSLDFGSGDGKLELRGLPEPFVLSLTPPALSECEKHGAYDQMPLDEAFDTALHGSIDMEKDGPLYPADVFDVDEFIGYFKADMGTAMSIAAGQIVSVSVASATVSFSVQPSVDGVPVQLTALQAAFSGYPNLMNFRTSNLVIDESGEERVGLPHILPLLLPTNVTLFDTVMVAASSSQHRPLRMQVISTIEDEDVEEILCDWEHPQGAEGSETCAADAKDFFARGSTSPCVGDQVQSFSECQFEVPANYTQPGTLSLHVVTVAERGGAQIDGIFYLDSECMSNAGETLGAFCSFWDTSQEQWVVDSKSGPGTIAPDGSITCSFDHLTDFNAFLGPKPDMNKPCFSCLDDFLKNPAGIIVVSVCGFLLLCTLGISVFRYVKYSKRDPEDIETSRFAGDRKAVMSPDAVHETSWQDDVKHRLRYDYSMGGICCHLDGDPFDWSQRAVVFVTTLIISLMVSLMFFSPPEPDCKDVCEPPKDELGQFLEDEPLICEEVCVDPPAKGIYVSIVSALISTPIVMGLGYLFTWLRKPVVEAVEPDGVKLKELLKRIADAKRNLVKVVEEGVDTATGIAKDGAARVGIDASFIDDDSESENGSDSDKKTKQPKGGVVLEEEADLENPQTRNDDAENDAAEEMILPAEPVHENLLHSMEHEHTLAQVETAHRKKGANDKLQARVAMKRAKTQRKVDAQVAPESEAGSDLGSLVKEHTKKPVHTLEVDAAIKIQASYRGRLAREKHKKLVEDMDKEAAAARVAASHKGQRQREKLKARLEAKQKAARVAEEQEARNMEEVTAIFRGPGALGLGIKNAGGEVQVVSALSNSLRELYGGCHCTIKPPSAAQPASPKKGKPSRWGAAKVVATDLSYYTDIPCPCDLVGIVAAGNGGKQTDVGKRRNGLDHDAVLDLLRGAKRPLQLIFEVAKPESSRKKSALSTGTWLSDVKKAMQEEERAEAERLKREEEERIAAKLADEHAGRVLPVPRRKHYAALPLCYGFIFGFSGLFMIYGIAANLGAERTAQWLSAAFLSLVIKVLIMDPVKVVAMACFVQYAETLDSDVAQRIADAMREVHT
jgi:hypothetical protein